MNETPWSKELFNAAVNAVHSGSDSQRDILTSVKRQYAILYDFAGLGPAQLDVEGRLILAYDPTKLATLLATIPHLKRMVRAWNTPGELPIDIKAGEGSLNGAWNAVIAAYDALTGEE